MRELPTGTVTLLFTDIKGSTRLLHHLGDRYVSMLETCLSLLRASFLEFNGHEVDTQGDVFFVAFARATDAVSAEIALSQGNLTAAHQLSEEAVTRYREMGINRLIALQLSLLARLGNYDKARQHYEELLPLFREVDDKDLTAVILEGLAGIVIVQGEDAWASRLLGAAKSLRQSSGIPLSPTEHMVYESVGAAARTHPGVQAFNAAWARGTHYDDRAGARRTTVSVGAHSTSMKYSFTKYY